MEPQPKRRIPRAAAFAVPVLALGLAVLLVSVAYRSNRVARSEEAEEAQESLPPIQATSDTFLGCTDCHGDLDKVFNEGKITNLLFTHARHFAKGVSDCSVCHSANTHEPDRVNPPTMSRCFMCHGVATGSIAPGECSICHPPGMPREPDSHFEKGWVPVQHSKAALTDQFECLTCHKQSFCDSCHGVTMPHPQGWNEQPHTSAYFQGPSVCEYCHPITEPQNRDFCDTCHHPQGPDNVSWRAYHPTAIKQRGANTCFQCHSPETCTACHRKGVLDLSADEQLLQTSPTPAPTPTPSVPSG